MGGIGACPQLNLPRVVGKEKVTLKERWALAILCISGCAFLPSYYRPGTTRCQTQCGALQRRTSTQGSRLIHEHRRRTMKTPMYLGGGRFAGNEPVKCNYCSCDPTHKLGGSALPGTQSNCRGKVFLRQKYSIFW